MTSQRVEILIDELVLHGFAASDRLAIGDALSLELQRLVESSHAAGLANIGNLDEMKAGTVSLQPGAGRTTVGAQVARSIHTSLMSKGI